MRDIRKRRFVILITSAVALVLATAAYIIIPAGVTNIEVLTSEGERLEESYDIYIGESVQLECRIKPKTFASRIVEYQSSAEDVLSVDETGLMTGIKEGQARLSVECAGVKKSVIIGIEPSVKEIRGIEEEITLSVGEEYQLKPKVVMSSKELDPPVVKYKSKRTKIVSVDDNGKITAIGEGTTRITVKAGTENVKIKVTVESSPANVVSTVTSDDDNDKHQVNNTKSAKKNKKKKQNNKDNSKSEDKDTSSDDSDSQPEDSDSGDTDAGDSNSSDNESGSDNNSDSSDDPGQTSQTDANLDSDE